MSNFFKKISDTLHHNSNSKYNFFPPPESYTEEGYCVKHKFKFSTEYIKSPFRDKWLMLDNTGCLKCLLLKDAEDATLNVRKLNNMQPIEYILDHEKIDAVEERAAARKAFK